jgi:ribosome-associated toxin RatA of RatAB toxin-antitoxin module
MYTLVSDVAAYPEFLPWCEKVEVLHNDEFEQLARIHMAIGKLHKGFTTRNRLEPERAIHMQLVEGPFRHLTGEWSFEPHNSGCRVSLDMRFEFTNRFFDLALGTPFHKIANSMVDAFIRRADEIHGRAD